MALPLETLRRLGDAAFLEASSAALELATVITALEERAVDLAALRRLRDASRGLADLAQGMADAAGLDGATPAPFLPLPPRAVPAYPPGNSALPKD